MDTWVVCWEGAVLAPPPQMMLSWHQPGYYPTTPPTQQRRSSRLAAVGNMCNVPQLARSSFCLLPQRGRQWQSPTRGAGSSPTENQVLVMKPDTQAGLDGCEAEPRLVLRLPTKSTDPKTDLPEVGLQPTLDDPEQRLLCGPRMRFHASVEPPNTAIHSFFCTESSSTSERIGEDQDSRPSVQTEHDCEMVEPILALS